MNPGSASPSSVRWGDLRLRVISAAVLAPLALGCIWLGGWVGLLALAVLWAVLAGEWLRMWRHRPGAGAMAAGLGYLVVPALALIWLRADPVAGRGNLFLVVFVVWASDIGAYLFGRVLGGPKLAPAISPGKTWSGALGGLLCAAGVGLAAVALFGGRAWHAAGVGLVLGVVSELGDLLESAIKRHFGVKDAGGLIPGHGGLFDRLDGLLAAAPAAALLAWAVGRGVELWR